MHDDEVCDIPGIGPIPVATARQLLGDSILKLVITKGTEALNVTHLGRGPNTAQHIALLWKSPTCTVEGCCRTRVENDHREPFATTRHTRLDELDPLCEHHHDQKTRKGWALTEGTGKRPLVPPDDPRHPKNRPKPRHGLNNEERSAPRPTPATQTQEPASFGIVVERRAVSHAARRVQPEMWSFTRPRDCIAA